MRNWHYELDKLLNHIHRDVDLHVNFHHAQIAIDVNKAFEQIDRQVAFEIRSISQLRRWFLFHYFSGR